MAQVLVPGVAQAVVSGTVSGHPYKQVWHFYNSKNNATWLYGDIQLLADTLFSHYKTEFLAQLANNVVVLGVTCTDIGTTTPATAVSAGTSGTASGPGPVSPGICYMANLQINVRYKGGHPRTYFPPLSSASFTANEDSWGSVQRGNMEQSLRNVQGAVSAAIPNTTWCVPLYTYEVLHDSVTGKEHRIRTGVKGTPQVQGFISRVHVATQRRRITA
jgi:hypothetical protein